mmetsp:Transcript_22253/g.42009  ORF Transcript_22253/g.42009 Transcript_22253/m.42009 type:complete len:128 (+) Transcript_22253:511-894(+)
MDERAFLIFWCYGCLSNLQVFWGVQSNEEPESMNHCKQFVSDLLSNNASKKYIQWDNLPNELWAQIKKIKQNDIPPVLSVVPYKCLKHIFTIKFSCKRHGPKTFCPDQQPKNVAYTLKSLYNDNIKN